MIGFSAKAPVSAFYVGGQLDPLQFLDISAGAYVYARPELLSGLAEGEIISGTTVPTHNTTHVAGFIAITSSVNLFTSWLSTTVKAP